MCVIYSTVCIPCVLCVLFIVQCIFPVFYVCLCLQYGSICTTEYVKCIPGNIGVPKCGDFTPNQACKNIGGILICRRIHK